MNPIALFMTIISDSEQYSLMLCVCRYMQVNTIKKKVDLTHEYRLQITSRLAEIVEKKNHHMNKQMQKKRRKKSFLHYYH